MVFFVSRLCVMFPKLWANSLLKPENFPVCTLNCDRLKRSQGFEEVQEIMICTEHMKVKFIVSL